jgi:DNA-binding NarL/FixJ family response regulator
MNPPIRVMLVDDHAVVREGYRRLLEAEPGIEVVAEQGDAESAYAELQAQPEPPVDVVVLDLSMPGRGGLDMARRVALRWPALRVLVFTMHDHPAMVAQALAAGAAGYVTKTTAPHQLVQALRRVAAGERPVLSAATAGPAAEPPPHMALTPREFDVFRLLVDGLPVDAIAERLSLSSKTVSNLQTAIRAKLGVTTGVELLRYAQLHGLSGP